MVVIVIGGWGGGCCPLEFDGLSFGLFGLMLYWDNGLFNGWFNDNGVALGW